MFICGFWTLQEACDIIKTSRVFNLSNRQPVRSTRVLGFRHFRREQNLSRCSLVRYHFRNKNGQDWPGQRSMKMDTIRWLRADLKKKMSSRNFFTSSKSSIYLQTYTSQMSPVLLSVPEPSFSQNSAFTSGMKKISLAFKPVFIKLGLNLN